MSWKRSRKRARSAPGRRWITTLVTSAAVALPLPVAASTVASADPRHWALARRPALPEFGFAGTPQDGQGGPDQPGRVYRFDLPPGSIAEAVEAIEAATGLSISFAEDALRELPAPGVAGSFTASQALAALLEGTGLSFNFTGSRSVRIAIAVAESITVSGTDAVLSSPKHVSSLRDTPQTIALIPSAVIAQQAAGSLRDALRNTPGITLTAGEGGTAPGDNLLIRGFSARNDVYVDGARDSGVTTRDTFNTEAIEVTKGPSSTISGRGATGGSVNIVTKSASLENFTSGGFTAGTADSGRATLDLNRRLGEHSAARLNLLWQDEGVPRRDTVRNRSWGVAPSVAFGLGTSTAVTLNYQHVDQNNVPDYGLPSTLPGPAVNEGITIDDLDFSNFYGLLSRDREKMRADLGTVIVRHQFGPGLSLRNLTRYGRHDLDRVVTPPRTATASASAADPGFDPSASQIRRTDTKYQERTDGSFVNLMDITLRFETGPIAHAVVTGAELAHERQPGYALTDRFSNGRPPVTSLFDPAPADPYTPDLVRTGASTDATSDTVAAYALDTITLSPRWQTSLGLRWDRVGVDYRATAADGIRADHRRTDAAPSGQAALVFKPVAAGTVYASYSTSFNPAFDGSFGLTLTDRTGSLADLPPEKTYNVEAGVKWDLRPGLLFTATAFRNEKTNAKTQDESGATVLAGDQRVTGVEVGLAGNISPRWTALTGLSVMKGTVRESGVAREVGRQLSYVPRVSFNAWSTYRVPRSDVTLGGGVQFMDGYFFNNENALASANAAAIQRLTRYWLFSAMASYDLNPHVRLQVNATNLSNARYVDRGYNGHFIPGAGRGILLGPIFRF
jgi:catecholate siderophore receptor